MNYSKISTRYAKALFLGALEEKKLHNVHKDLQLIQAIINDNKEFILFLQTPIYSPDEKKDFLKNFFESKIDFLTMNFLLLLANQRRENRLNDIIRVFFTLYNEHHQIVNASLITSYKLEEDFIQEFKKRLEESLSKTVQLQNEIDENIIGGFILHIEDKEFDASIKNQLNKIKSNLENTSMI
jgi:F-type H+-transporting ATPase subunit delta